jgi:hypothetical protein
MSLIRKKMAEMELGETPMWLHTFINYTENRFTSIPLASDHDGLLPEDDRRPLRSKFVQQSL